MPVWKKKVLKLPADHLSVVMPETRKGQGKLGRLEKWKSTVSVGDFSHHHTGDD